MIDLIISATVGALACETRKAAHGVKKMARLLRGEEA